MATADLPVNLSLNTEELARRWAEIAVDKFHQALDKYDIGKLDGPLWQSIVNQVVANNGDVEKVITRFKQYGRFVDMGVGRGMPIGGKSELGEQFSQARNERGQLHRYNRKPKPWYSKTYYSQVQRFRELFIEHFDQLVPAQIAEALKGDITLTA